MEKWFNKSVEEALEALHSQENGLTSEVIAGLQQQYGKNELQASKQKSKLALFLGQFKDVMIIILIGAAIISFAVGEHTDAYVILFIIFGNAILGFVQENKAEESIRKLQQMGAQHALVLRDGKPQKIESQELVPGDVVLLEAGNMVPADGRLIEISALKTEEAVLTGESHSIEKQTSPLTELDLPLGDQTNMVFKGTGISNGSAKMLVTSTGMQTEMGNIAKMLEGESQKTPLQKRLAVFSKQLVVIVLIIGVLVFLYGWWRGEPLLNLFLTALSLTVAALPEALPAVITISLANGAARMVRQNALVRRLPAVETLGSVSYICTDKTGTLTKNSMTVEKRSCESEQDTLMLQAFMLNNEVRVDKDQSLLGDSTEVALVRYALEQGLTQEKSEQELPLIDKLPFDSERMRMSTLHQKGDQYILLIKGAPARIAEVLRTNYQEKKEVWLDENRDWAGQGLRVLFLAYKILDEKPAQITAEMEKDLDFLGMVGMIDPPREEVQEAIAECNSAGIKTVMITGDQPLTAFAIAKRLGMSIEDPSETLTGKELAKLTQEELSDRVLHTTVYARVSPEQKLNIVKTLQEQNQVVSMTGDGVNDAPSLKQADIGVAMGITGSDVAKESAEMILQDDNFATIVKAVKEGRRIYDNIRKFILYVLSCNLSEILIIFFAPIIGLAIPLLPIHILWINLVTDGLPGIALANEPAEKNIMKKPPRPAKEGLFAGNMVFKILSTGIIMTVGAFILQIIAAQRGYDMDTQHSMVFSYLCLVQLGNALSVRSESGSILTTNPFRNPFLLVTILLTGGLQFLLIYFPPLQPIFKTSALGQEALTLTLALTLGSIVVVEILKGIIKAVKS
ncbi:cation-translocating P-type ATPase [Dyadobacter tibetensis]|uniref:cation-translocating P-type ATPase n=1 Tax=Dyadobacter tibetensis TaxID=1211851 RepID=UPI000471CA22|nr:cation-translocating P-type ATPase [Dyadobacter tibetensis]